LTEAEDAYQKVVAFGQSENDQTLIAFGYRNLGNVYGIRGELEKTKEMYQKALALFQEIGATPQVEQTQEALADLKNQ